MIDRTRIEALWLEPWTAQDIATAANIYCGDGRKISAQGVREIWEKAKREGRLPQIDRPMNGFNENMRSIVVELMKIGTKQAA